MTVVREGTISVLVGGSGRGLVRPSVSPTVVTRVKVGVVSVSRGEDLSGWGSFTTPAVSVRRREMVWMVGSEEVLGRRARAVHHFWRRRRPGGQRTTAWRGDQVRVAVHLKYQSGEITQSALCPGSALPAGRD